MIGPSAAHPWSLSPHYRDCSLARPQLHTFAAHLPIRLSIRSTEYRPHSSHLICPCLVSRTSSIWCGAVVAPPPVLTIAPASLVRLLGAHHRTASSLEISDGWGLRFFSPCPFTLVTPLMIPTFGPWLSTVHQESTSAELLLVMSMPPWDGGFFLWRFPLGHTHHNIHTHTHTLSLFLSPPCVCLDPGRRTLELDTHPIHSLRDLYRLRVGSTYGQGC